MQVNCNKMKTLFEDRFVRIWNDGFSPVVFIRITSFPDSECFVSINKAISRFVRQVQKNHKHAYAMMDLGDADSAIPEVSQLLKTFSRLLPDSSLSFMAVVNPKRADVSKELKLLGVEDRICGFHCFEKAMRNINERMSLDLLSE
jgi:hypothetical protein